MRLIPEKCNVKLLNNHKMENLPERSCEEPPRIARNTYVKNNTDDPRSNINIVVLFYAQSEKLRGKITVL